MVTFWGRCKRKCPGVRPGGALYPRVERAFFAQPAGAYTGKFTQPPVTPHIEKGRAKKSEHCEIRTQV